MIAMSDIPAPIAFPLNLDAQPIVAYAQNLKQLTVGLETHARSLVDISQARSSSWQGVASNAFRVKVIERASNLTQAAQEINGAPDVLIQYAETIRWAQNAHADAMRTYYAAWNQLPYSESVLRQCVDIQRQVIEAANTVATQVAGALQTIRSHFVYLSIGLPLPITDSWGLLPNESVAGPFVSASPPRRVPEPLTTAEALGQAKYVYKFGLWTAEAHEIAMHDHLHKLQEMIKTNGKLGGKPFIKDGKEVLAWKRGANLTATYGTLAEATANTEKLAQRVARLKVKILGGNVIGAALSGVVQGAEDWDKDLNKVQRSSRVAAATVLEGGGAWGGFVAGAAAGGAGGLAFLGIGAVPGAIIGGLIGAYAGSKTGGWLKERAFEYGPTGVFGGK
jgi:hypothetical protein